MLGRVISRRSEGIIPGSMVNIGREDYDKFFNEFFRGDFPMKEIYDNFAKELEGAVRQAIFFGRLNN